MKKIIQSFLLLVIFSFIFHSSVSAQDENPLDIDPTKYCSVAVNQIRGTELLNKYDKTHLFKIPSAGEDLSGVMDYSINFTFDMRHIPESYWTIFKDNDGNGILDQLENSWINFDLDANLSDQRCYQEMGDINPSIQPNSVINYTTTATECYQDNLEGSKEFIVALRYKVGQFQYKTICQQTITVDEKEFDDLDDVVVPKATIIYDTDNKLHNVTSVWKITIKDVKLPESFLDSLLDQLSVYDLRVSSERQDDTSNPFELPIFSQTVSNYIVDNGNLASYIAPGIGVRELIEDSSHEPYIHFDMKFENPGDYYLSLFVNKDVTHVVKIGDVLLRVNPEGVTPPTPTQVPQPTGSPDQCQAEIRKAGGRITQALCNGVCAGIAECAQLKTLDARNICENVQDIGGVTGEKKKCEDCVSGGNAYTAFGCLPTSVEGFLSTVVFQLGLGLAGGVAFLLMIWGSFTMIISQGDPQQIERGREIIISAVTGLLLIIFSVIIMQFFGYNILHIPGFGDSETVGVSGEGGDSGDTADSPAPPPVLVTPTDSPALDSGSSGVSVSATTLADSDSLDNNLPAGQTVIFSGNVSSPDTYLDSHLFYFFTFSGESGRRCIDSIPPEIVKDNRQYNITLPTREGVLSIVAVSSSRSCEEYVAGRHEVRTDTVLNRKDYFIK